jgi:O-antigen/teichoic acid export membrane protein
VSDLPPPEPVPTGERFAGRMRLRGRSLREVAARGTLVNGAFSIGLSGVGLIRGFVLAAFLARADYGVWGILVVSLGTLLWLKQVGIGDRYIQQDEADQEAAFQRAFTLELAFTAVWMVLLAALVPLLVVVYGEDELLLPGLVVIALLPAGALQAPLWIHARRMEFVRQRTLMAIDPIVGFVVSVALAAAGAGYWALVAGVLAGAWTSALAAVATSPFPLRLRWDRGALRRYASFSWPIAVANGSSMVIAQSAMLATEAKLGLAGAGAITLAAQVSQFTDRVDHVVTGTLYPAVCAVRDRLALLHESFVKSNRLALMWAVPFGFALTLFASDLVEFGIGEEWRPAVVVLEVYGVVAALNHIGFNWDAYFRARDDTRPMAVAGVLSMVVFLATALPLLAAYGLEGFAAGVAAQALVHVAVRSVYLARLFEGFALARHAVRAIAPTVPAVLAVLAVRALEDGERTAAWAAGELVLFAALTAAATVALEGPLLREAARYARGMPSPPTPRDLPLDVTPVTD